MTKILHYRTKKLFLILCLIYLHDLNGRGICNTFQDVSSHSSYNKLNKKVDSSLCFYRFGIKVNVLSHFGLGMEFPVTKRSSLELYARTYSINVPMGQNISKTNLRINYKLHLAIHDKDYPVNSMFFIFGWNLKARSEEGWKEQNLYTIETYMADMVVLGIGKRMKNFEFWIAGERALNVRYNTYSKSYDRMSYYTVDRDNTPLLYSVSGGLAFYLIQSKAIKK